jgi:flagellar assembly protein FliH
MERKDPLFQQVRVPHEAHFQLPPFLSKSPGFPVASVAGEGGDGSSPSPEAEIGGKKAIEEIIAEAKHTAQKIKNDAYQEGLTQGLAQGMAQGLAQGRDKGQAEARKEVRDRLLPLEDTLGNLIKQVEKVQGDILIEQEQDILHLCIKMAQKIIHAEINQNPELILANLREGLKSIGHHKVVAIRLNPRDLDRIQYMREQISQSILNLEGVTLEGDPGLLAGGCLIQTELGHVDASIETQLQELEKTLSMVAGGAMGTDGPSPSIGSMSADGSRSVGGGENR